jgi:hypothetical protein
LKNVRLRFIRNLAGEKPAGARRHRNIKFGIYDIYLLILRLHDSPEKNEKLLGGSQNGGVCSKL